MVGCMLAIAVVIAERVVESKPRCGRCGKIGLECVYAAVRGVSKFPVPAKGTRISCAEYSMSVDLVETDLADLLSMSSRQSPGLSPFVSAERGNIRILQHFQSVASLTLGSWRIKEVMHSFVAKSAWYYHYLMHMVLAVSFTPSWIYVKFSVS